MTSRKEILEHNLCGEEDRAEMIKRKVFTSPGEPNIHINGEEDITFGPTQVQSLLHHIVDEKIIRDAEDDADALHHLSQHRIISKKKKKKKKVGY